MLMISVPAFEKEKLKTRESRKNKKKANAHKKKKKKRPTRPLLHFLLRYNIQSKQKMVSHLSPLLVAMRSHCSRNTDCDALRGAFTF